MNAIRKTLILLGFGLAAFLSVDAAHAAPPPQRQWVATWATAPQATGVLAPDFPSGFENQTLRQIVHVSVGGTAVRIRLSNAFGTQPVRLDAVYVGLQDSGARLRGGSNTAVAFGGSPGVSIPIGASALSDPVAMNVPALANLEISLFTLGATGPPTLHLFGNQLNFVAAGDAASEESGAPFGDAVTASWFFLEGVDVLASSSIQGAVIALGDSLTDGLGSTWDANTRYPDFLARRFLASAAGRVMSVVNLGLSGGRVLNNSPCFGTNVLARLDRDALTRTGARAVIFTAGSNDFGFPVVPSDNPLPPECLQPNTLVSADDVIAGYRQVIARVHAAGLEIFGGTLNPIKGGSEGSPETEVKRQALNAWIRGSGEFDGVIDFASAVADPSDPERLAPLYDSGDATHPNDAGYEAMANAISLRLFR